MTLYVRVGVLLTCRRHLYDSIISLRGEVLAHKTSLAPSFFFIEMPVPSLESELSCTYLCVTGINFASIFLLD